jgi:hypothetical protein
MTETRGPCAKCVHFRRARPPSQLLKVAVGADAAASEVAGALTKITDDEQKLRDTEADWKSKEGTADRDLWGARPLMSDYCAINEADEIFRIAAVKNRGLGCADFRAEKAESHPCSSCAHHIPAEGREYDQRMESIYTKTLAGAMISKAPTQGAEGLLQSYRSGEGSRKALEVSQAYSAKGYLLTKPEYLDHCATFSTPDEYAVCALLNTHSTCPVWEPRARTNPPRRKSS